MNRVQHYVVGATPDGGEAVVMCEGAPIHEDTNLGPESQAWGLAIQHGFDPHSLHVICADDPNYRDIIITYHRSEVLYYQRLKERGEDNE